MRSYADKPCRQCGGMFAPTGPRSMYCDACRDDAAREHAVARDIASAIGGYGTCPSTFVDSIGTRIYCSIEDEHDEHGSGVWCWTDRDAS